jgi:hypothetical protein
MSFPIQVDRLDRGTLEHSHPPRSASIEDLVFQPRPVDLVGGERQARHAPSQRCTDRRVQQTDLEAVCHIHLVPDEEPQAELRELSVLQVIPKPYDLTQIMRTNFGERLPNCGGAFCRRTPPAVHNCDVEIGPARP